MYMSYCRFEGTLHEMRACMEEVDDHYHGEAQYAVSNGEIEKFRDMVEEMISFLNEYALLNECGDLDEEELDKVCEALRKTEQDWKDEEPYEDWEP